MRPENDLFKSIFSRDGKPYDIEECKKLIKSNSQLMDDINLRSIVAALITHLTEKHLLDMNDLQAGTDIVKEHMIQKYAEKMQKELNSAMDDYLSE